MCNISIILVESEITTISCSFDNRYFVFVEKLSKRQQPQLLV